MLLFPSEALSSILFCSSKALSIMLVFPSKSLSKIAMLPTVPCFELYFVRLHRHRKVPYANLVYIYIERGHEHIHARSIDEQSQAFTASRDPSKAFSNSFFERPSETERARAASADSCFLGFLEFSWFSQAERLRRARVFWMFSSFLGFHEFSWFA